MLCLLNLLWKWSAAISVMEFCNYFGVDRPISLIFPYVDSQEVMYFINNHGLHATFPRFVLRIHEYSTLSSSYN